MRSRQRIMLRSGALLAFIVSVCALSINAQRVALVAPQKSDLDKALIGSLRAEYSGALKVQDLDMTETAFDSTGRAADAFNLTIADAHDLAAVLGCDFYILVRTGTQRRAGVGKPDYFESYAVFYVVSGRTGRLIKWDLVSENGTDKDDAEHRLVRALGLPKYYAEISAAWKNEAVEIVKAPFEQIPDTSSPAAKNFRSPVPYLRLKPDYTRTAYLYEVTATVEAMVDLDDKGQIANIEISKWAGYGLDESVISAVRSMNWRPAERGGKPLPARFLVRYNFKKLEKTQPNDE